MDCRHTQNQFDDDLAFNFSTPFNGYIMCKCIIIKPIELWLMSESMSGRNGAKAQIEGEFKRLGSIKGVF